MLKAEKAIYDFWTFCDLISLKGGTKNFAQCHKEFAAFLAKPQYTNHQMGVRRLGMMARGLAKSTLCVAYVLWRIYRNPDIRILLANNSKRLGRAFIRELRQYLESPELQKKVWDCRPHVKGALVPALNQKSRAAKKEQLEALGYDDSYINDAVDTKVIWSMEAIQVLRPGTIKEPTVQLVSVGALVTGEHYDLIIMDDVVDMQNSNTSTKAEIVIDWTRDLESVLDPSRETRIKFPDGRKTIVDWVGEEIVTVGTPYFSHDLYAYMEANSDEMGLEVFRRNIYVNGENADDGYSWEARLNEEIVNRRRARLNSPQLFSSQYLLQVIDREVTGFDTTNCQYFDEPDLLDDGKVRVKLPGTLEAVDVLPVLVLDPAATTSATADYSVIAVGGSDKYGNLYIFEAMHLKESFVKVVDAIFTLILKYSLRTVRIEAVGGFAALPDLFRERAAMRGIKSGVIPFVPSGGKEDRITVKLQPYFDSNSIYFHRKLAINKELHQQLKHFPVHAHDDYPDALAMVSQFAFKHREQTHRHKAKFEVNRKYGGVR